MSIATEITRLQTAKANINSSLEAKGVSVPSSATIDTYSTLLDSIREAEPKDVNFFDYDGTILYSYTATEFQSLSALPPNPKHTGLTAQGWNWSLADAKAEVTATGALNIGQAYVTDDRKTRLYIRIQDCSRMPLSLNFGGGNFGFTIDWGDGSAVETKTNTAGNVLTLTHSYASPGNYVILIAQTSGNVVLGVVNSKPLIGPDFSASYSDEGWQKTVLYKVELGTNMYIVYHSFFAQFELESITMPLGQDVSYAFRDCWNLKFVVFSRPARQNVSYLNNCWGLKGISFPKGTNNFDTSVFQNCRALKYITFPSTLTILRAAAFNSCGALSGHINIPSGVTEIGYSAFMDCWGITKVTVPATVTTVGTGVFSKCKSVKYFYFYPTTPPTLAGSDVFAYTSDSAVIYVPSASVNAYKTATNWTTVASKIQAMP